MFRTKVVAKLIILFIFISYFLPAYFMSFYKIEGYIGFGLYIALLIIGIKEDRFAEIGISTLGVILFNPIIPVDFLWKTWIIVFKIFIPITIISLLSDVVLFIKDKRKGFGDFKSFTVDKKSGLYVVVDSGYKYEMDTPLYNNLKSYMRESQIGLVSHWYNQLSEEDKEKISISSEYEGL